MFNIDAQLKADLDLLPCFIRIASISPIEQGDSHQSFKVIDQNKVYFVKRLSKLQNVDENNLVVEISRQLSITPTLIFSTAHWQVYEYINGQSLALTSLSMMDKVNTCIDVMVLCHDELSFIAKDINLHTLNPRKVINELSINLSEQQWEFIDKIVDKLCNPLLVSPVTICHGDINFFNIITEQHVWLIDFECACLADAEFDIAMMIAINELDYTSIRIIIEYCIKSYQFKSKNKVKLSKDMIMNYLSFCYLINGLWYKERSGKVGSDLFSNKANKQFDYFDKLSLGCESLLKQMR